MASMRPDLDRKLRHRQPREVRGLRIGSLFSGYGGLDMGVMAALGGSVAWHVEFDKAPGKILAHHWPEVPNYGDVTKVKWAPDCPTCGGSMGVYRHERLDHPQHGEPFYWCPPCEREWDVSIRFDDPDAHLIPEPVDIITGGSPCQDLSHAGKRQGMTEGTRSNLWVAMREAIAQLRPGLVVWENVRGAYSAAADSELEQCAGCVGGSADRGPSLRALGRVLGDLSDLGYDCRWHGLRAADVGAPHGRFRVFILAWDASGKHAGALSLIRGGSSLRSGVKVSARGSSDAALLPTPRTSDTNGAGQHGDGGLDLRTAVSLLPTPAVNDMGEGKTVEAWDEWTAKMQAAHGNGNGYGKSLAIEAQRLLPTPRGSADRTGRSAAVRQDSMSAPSLGQAIEISQGILPREFTSWDELPQSWQPGTSGVQWGIYADAIARWEALTRPAPAPTQPSKKGTPQLSPAFSEWLMGLPEGHVTDVPGLSRNDMLKALGNGVVPQQAEAALRFLLGAWEVAA